MKESDTIETLQRRKFKWDKIVGTLKIMLGVYAFLVLTYLAVQGIVAQTQISAVLKQVNATTDAVRESQLENQKTGTDSHEKTRQYIKCLFTAVLTVPVAERTNVDFDTCTKQDNDGSNVDTSKGKASSSTPSQQPATPSQPTTTTPKPSEPVAAAPPDPEPTPDDRSALGKLPIIGGLFDALGL